MRLSNPIDMRILREGAGVSPLDTIAEASRIGKEGVEAILVTP
jgi:hypothetical protein